MSQIEDSVSIFPILIVDWKITDRISLETGRGLGATQGPGLNLNYRLSDTWSFGLGGRYESLRFRLDDRGSAPDGVGEDRSVPVYVSATYSRGRDLQISAIGSTRQKELHQSDFSNVRMKISYLANGDGPYLFICRTNEIVQNCHTYGAQSDVGENPKNPREGRPTA